MNKKEIFNRIEYVVACVGAFAQRYKLSNSQAYAYLRRFSGIDFLLDCYAAEHTLSIDDAVSDLQVLCSRKGGEDMIRLYHGSNVVIEEIDLSRSRRGKDFGQGFYLNANYDQAMAMAMRTARFMNEGQPTLSCFEYDEVRADEMRLNIKVFPDYSEEWAEFVVMNRKNNSDIPAHSYDIVIGPIADDTVGVQIRRYIMGYMPVSSLIEELKFKGDHAIQYFFGTSRAVELLKRIEL